ncbi:MAG TPA: amidohydrolase family protein [Candidatus Binatia bacterium]|nr:amidohydrolase family protein [Candidatus Binatia bacterium]
MTRDESATAGDVRHYEVLITGGTVVDGTGAPRYEAAVGVTRPWAGASATLVVLREADAIEEAIGQSDRLIEAHGKVVAPGFIDLHSHSGLVLLADPLHEAKVQQGVTTEVVGVDGLSYAPIRLAAHMRELVEMNAGLDGSPEVEFDWASVEQYLERLDGKSVNVAFLVGNSALRLATTGWANVEPKDHEIAEMRAMLREAMEEGAYGLSSGLDYPPGSFASTGELATLAAEAAKLHGIYHTHVRYTLGDQFLDPFREAIEIGRRGGTPAHITHFYHRATFPGTPEEMLQLVDDARAEGLDVTFDAYPYEWASTRLLITIPTWVQEGGPARTKERLADREVRSRIRDELQARGVLYAGEGGIADIRLGAFRSPENRHCEGRTLGEVCAEEGTDLVDRLCDMLLQEDLRLNQVTPGPHTDGIRRFYQHRWAMVGTDSTFVGWKPSPRTYGSYPRILGQFVRDEGVLRLEEAVAKMTSMPADRLGLKHRGRIVDGAIADLVIFDPATVRSNATYDEPRRAPDGISHVLVDGRFVLDEGHHTGATPGRALRRGRD